MKKTFFLVSYFLFSVVHYNLYAQAPKEPTINKVAFTNVAIVDVENGILMPDMTVLIEGDRIKQVAKSNDIKIPKDIRTINASGKFLMPGLYDMHVHLSLTSVSALPLLVANGITAVRDMGGSYNQINEWRVKIKEGLLTGPQIYMSGPMLNGKSFNPLQFVPGDPDETRAIVRLLKYLGADFIKVHRRLPRESYFAALDEAKKQHLPLTGHIPITVTPKEASDSGHASIEHMETLFEGTFSSSLNGKSLPDAIKLFREDSAKILFDVFAKNKTPFTPTLSAYRSIIESADTSIYFSNIIRKKYIAKSFLKLGVVYNPKFSKSELEEVKNTFSEFKLLIPVLKNSGVTLLAGTDLSLARIPGVTLHEELALLVESGLSPAEAIRTATINPAKFLGVEKDYGSVAPGKIANLILLEADPLINILNTQKINSVILKGKLVDRKALDKLLLEVERTALLN